MSFPVNVENAPNTKLRTHFSFDDLYSLAILEGINSGVYLDKRGVVPVGTGSSLTVGNMSFGPPSTHYLLESLTITVTGGGGRVQVNLVSGPDNTSDALTIRQYLSGGSVTIPMKRIIYAGTTANIIIADGDGTSNVAISLFAAGRVITADLNLDANKNLLMVGDSVWYGSAYGGLPLNAANILTANNPENHFPFLIKNHFQRRGIDCRLILKAMGSKSSVDFEAWRKYGWLDLPKVDCIFWCHEINDAAGTTDAVYTQNIMNFIDHRDRFWPDAPIVLVGGTPSLNNTTEARQAQLRVIKQNIVDANPDRNLKYMDLSTSFPREASYYVDGVGPAHITTATSVNNVAPAAISWIDTNNFTF